MNARQLIEREEKVYGVDEKDLFLKLKLGSKIVNLPVEQDIDVSDNVLIGQVFVHIDQLYPDGFLDAIDLDMPFPILAEDSTEVDEDSYAEDMSDLLDLSVNLDRTRTWDQLMARSLQYYDVVFPNPTAVADIMAAAEHGDVRKLARLGKRHTNEAMCVFKWYLSELNDTGNDDVDLESAKLMVKAGCIDLGGLPADTLAMLNLDNATLKDQAKKALGESRRLVEEELPSMEYGGRMCWHDTLARAATGEKFNVRFKGGKYAMNLDRDTLNKAARRALQSEAQEIEPDLFDTGKSLQVVVDGKTYSCPTEYYLPQDAEVIEGYITVDLTPLYPPELTGYVVGDGYGGGWVIKYAEREKPNGSAHYIDPQTLLRYLKLNFNFNRTYTWPEVAAMIIPDAEGGPPDPGQGPPDPSLVKRLLLAAKQGDLEEIYNCKAVANDCLNYVFGETHDTLRADGLAMARNIVRSGAVPMSKLGVDALARLGLSNTDLRQATRKAFESTTVGQILGRCVQGQGTERGT